MVCAVAGAVGVAAEIDDAAETAIDEPRLRAIAAATQFRRGDEDITLLLVVPPWFVTVAGVCLQTRAAGSGYKIHRRPGTEYSLRANIRYLAS
jgi:hypothetical protein